MIKHQKIIISCGGTGGHIFPGLEIARAFQKKDDNLDVLFVGALGRMEMKKIPKAGFSIIGIWIQGLYRKSIIKNIFFPIKLIVSLIQSFFILLYYKPVAVIGTGGFASFPILYVSSFLKIKTYIQEQNCYAGLANRLLSKRVHRIFVAHDNMHKFFPENKILNLGNPVRKSLKVNSVSKESSRSFFGLEKKLFTVLFIGGSLGAEQINDALLHYLADLEGAGEKDLDLNQPRFQLIWQTGLKHYDQIHKQINSSYLKSENLEKLQVVDTKNMKVTIVPFIDRMDLAYNAADLVVSRAGAIAIAEICFLSKASILIPSPYVTDNHQQKNAEYLSKNNAAIMISNIGPVFKKDLINNIYSFIKNLSFLRKTGENAHNLFHYNAAEEIVDVVFKDTQN